MSIAEAICALKCEMEKACICPENGLGTELFLFSSTLAPVVNVDLLIMNPKGQVLLAWRDDEHCGTGWHIPGGCIRYRETLWERIQKTAMDEIGSAVRYHTKILHVFETINDGEREATDKRERAHFITLVVACRMPEQFDIAGQPKKSGEPGYLRWFTGLPDDLLPPQQIYRRKWATIQNKIRRTENDAEMDE